MSRVHGRGRDAPSTLPSSDFPTDMRDSGNLLDGMGSASSLASSTSSSVFSANAQAARSNGHLSSATPLTHPDSSPMKPLSPYPGLKPSRHATTAGTSPYALSSAATPRGPSDNDTPRHSPPPNRPQARPPPGKAKGYKVVYDPELDKLGRKEEKKNRPKLKAKDFGTETYEPDPPPDPRLAIVGYTSGNCVPKSAPQEYFRKTRLRIAPHVQAPYRHDPRLTIGPGPAKQIVVQGFDPFTPDSQLKAFFSSFGDIAELRNQTDPATGSFLGICLVKYKESKPIRGTAVSAASAAKRAEKEGHGERIGLNRIKVERDREGAKCKRQVEASLKRTRRELEREHARHAPPPPPAFAAPEHVPTPSSVHTPVEDLPAPPPNAPRGPAGRALGKPPPEPRKPEPTHTSTKRDVEAELIVPKIKRKPYIFISAEHVPVLSSTLPHLQKRLKNFDWKEVRADKSGYYAIFDDSKRGEDETVRCFKELNGGLLFTYRMKMECQQYGNPDYERSPSPETQASENRKREEFARLQREQDEDLEEEKKQRAAYLDPVRGALEQLQADLRNKLMDDVRLRITIPTLHDCLDPARHSAKRRKLDLPDPSDNENRVPALLINKALESGTSKGRGQRARPLRPHDPHSQRSRTTNVYADERRVRKAPPKHHARPLHFKFQQMYDEDDSDDERRTSITRDTEDQESRPLSRASRNTTPFGDAESVAESVTPHKRRKLDHKPDTSQAPEDEEEEEEEEEEDDLFNQHHRQFLGDILRKQPEGMARGELELVTSTLPQTFKFSRRCKAELASRLRSISDDELFSTKRDDTTKAPAPTISITAEDESKIDADKMDIDDLAVKPAAKERSRKRKKTKKQVFEERAALKEAARAIAESEFVETDAIDQIQEKERELREAEEVAEEPAQPQVEWAVSTDRPLRTVEDDLDMILDIDGCQHLIKDDEDYEHLKNALKDVAAAALPDGNIWAWKQKEIKTLNTGGVHGPVYTEAAKIQGYYVPNSTGSARTEGIKKILNSEKSKYLPHRIKVQKAREEREAQANADPAVAAEKAKQEIEAAAKNFTTNVNARTNRANNRRLVNDINLQKATLSTNGAEADQVRFNQLKKRKKLVKFDRSAIHGWGLYAMESIVFNDMIIEYVGEIVRQKVADLREERYTKQGIGSSYLFRMVDDEIVDATKQGGIARFINHSCTPNCTAKIIKVEGTRRIVIYALKDIAKNEELTYDYKFEREYGSTDRIPCLCGSAGCKGFLN